MLFSLLETPLFTVQEQSSTESLTLPGLLAQLSGGDIESFRHLRFHQEQSWYCFLVQLAALVSARHQDGSLPTSTTDWKEALLSLSDRESSWALVSEDVTNPAFFQPPVPERALDAAGYRSDTKTPDDLDVLISSTAHSVKPHQISAPRLEHWIYALVTLQTSQGFIGRGNYGIARMNAGFGNRPLFTISPGLSWGKSFRRDVKVLLRQRQEIEGPFRLDGHALLWDLPWDGAKESSLSLSSLDPHFIEVCRRIRLTSPPSSSEDPGRALTCWRTTTKGPRVDVPDSLNGRLQDPWTPVNTAEGKSVTIGERGFRYQQLASIFFEDTYRASPAFRLHDFDLGRDEDLFLLARTLVRGQGKTKGIKYRLVPLPDPSLLSENLEFLSDRAQELLRRCSESASSLLYPSIGTYLGSDGSSGDGQSRLSRLIDPFNEAINDRFFSLLFSSLGQPEEEALSGWESALHEIARDTFDTALRSATVSTSYYWRRRAEATDTFGRRARSVLPHAFD